MHDLPQVSFGPCHLVVRKGTGTVDIQKSIPKEPAYRLVVVRPTDKRVIARWWPGKPDPSEWMAAVVDGVRRQRVGDALVGCLVPASLVRSHRALIDRLDAEGIAAFFPNNAAEAGVAQVRTTDAVVDDLIWRLRQKFAEGPPTVDELNDAGSAAPGWAVFTGIRDQAALDAWAERICAGRGRELGEAQERARRAASGAAVNQSRGAIAEEDMLDVYERKIEQYAGIYSPLPSAAIDALRRWRTAPDDDRAEIEAEVVKLLVRDFVIRTSTRPARMRFAADITPSSVLIGQEWADRLDRWFAQELNAGVAVTSTAWATMCQLDIELAPSMSFTPEQRWVRNLPEKPLLHELFIRHAGTQLIEDHVQSTNNGMIQKRSIGPLFARLHEQLVRPVRDVNQPLTKVEVLTPPKSNSPDRPSRLRCFVLAQGMPAATSLLAVDLTPWIRAANARLEAWSAGCGIQGVVTSELRSEGGF